MASRRACTLTARKMQPPTPSGRNSSPIAASWAALAGAAGCAWAGCASRAAASARPSVVLEVPMTQSERLRARSPPARGDARPGRRLPWSDVEHVDERRLAFDVDRLTQVEGALAGRRVVWRRIVWPVQLERVELRQE